MAWLFIVPFPVVPEHSSEQAYPPAAARIDERIVKCAMHL